MQRSFECDICTDFYARTTKLPKTLSCGHGFCLPCIESVHKGPILNCPKCRQPTDLPLGKACDLPTNFLILEILDSTCKKCYDRSHSGPCDHCQHDLCDACKQSHHSESPKPKEDTRFAIGDFRKVITRLQRAIAEDNTLQQVTVTSENLISEMEDARQDQVRKLDTMFDQIVSLVKSTVLAYSKSYLEWKHKIGQLVLNSSQSLDELDMKTKLKASSRGTDDARKCQQNMAALQELESQKPLPGNMNFVYNKEYFETNLSSSFVLSVDGLSGKYSKDYTDDPSLRQGLPDYEMASVKAVVQVRNPSSICVDKNTGNIFIACLNQKFVYVYDEHLQFRRPIEFREPLVIIRAFRKSLYLFTKEGNMYVTDMSGTLEWSREQIWLNDAAFDENGVLYLCNDYNVQAVSAERYVSFDVTFAEKSEDRNNLQVGVSSQGEVFVLDNECNINVYKFTQIGDNYSVRLLRQFDADYLHFAVDACSNLVTYGSLNMKLSIFTDSGKKYCVTPQLKELQYLSEMLVTNYGDIVVCSHIKDVVVLLNVPRKK